MQIETSTLVDCRAPTTAAAAEAKDESEIGLVHRGAIGSDATSVQTTQHR